MASFSITTPEALDDVKIAIQDSSPDFLHSLKTFNAISPGGQSFTATTLINSFNYVTGITLPLGQPNEMTNIVVRPNIGQVYPRSI